MKSKQTSLKRLTFQGVINTEHEKLPQKSRSKSKTRSKASSITKQPLTATNRSTEVHPSKGDSKSCRKIEQGSRTASESIFRSGQRNQQQEIMKKIIKLKNQTTHLEKSIKEADAGKKEQSVKRHEAEPQDGKQSQQLQEMQNFLQQFDAEIRKQSKQIGEFYLNQLDQPDSQAQRKYLEVPQFKPLSLPQVTPVMPALQAKLNQLQQMLSKSRR